MAGITAHSLPPPNFGLRNDIPHIKGRNADSSFLVIGWLLHRNESPSLEMLLSP